MIIIVSFNHHKMPIRYKQLVGAVALTRVSILSFDVASERALSLTLINWSAPTRLARTQSSITLDIHINILPIMVT